MNIPQTLFSTRGAISAVARRLGVTAACVSQWRKRGIPARRMADVDAALREHVATIARDAGAQFNNKA